MTNATEADLRQEILQLQNRITVLVAEQKRGAELAAEAADRLNLFEAMLEIVPVGVVLTDINGRIVMGNKTVEKMLRHPVLHSESAEDYGEWISYHADGSRVQSHEYPLAKVISDGADHVELDVNYQRGDDTRFWMRIIGQPVHDKSGARIGAVVALVDVDRENQLAAQQTVLIGELNHRVKNAFSVVKSIVSMSLRKASVPDGLRTKIDERLDAYAQAHAKLVGSDWDHADLSSIIEDIVVNIGGGRVKVGGPNVDLPSRHALAISMALYELSTNAIKHGALSVPDGRVELTWTINGDEEGAGEVLMNWVERDGPETVVPTEKGFGSFVVDRALTIETDGDVKLSYPPSGFEWTFRMPLR